MLNKTLPSTPSSGRDSKQKLMTPDIPLLKSILKTPNTPRNSSGVHFEPPRDLSGMYTRAHCSYLDIYISQNLELCKGDFAGKFQIILQAKGINFFI